MLQFRSLSVCQGACGNLYNKKILENNIIPNDVNIFDMDKNVLTNADTIPDFPKKAEEGLFINLKKIIEDKNEFSKKNDRNFNVLFRRMKLFGSKQL